MTNDYCMIYLELKLSYCDLKELVNVCPCEGKWIPRLCFVSGTPTPTVRWSRRDGPLPPDHAVSGGLLRITRMRPEYAGEYVCTISNVDGSTSASFYLAVQGRYNIMFNHRSPSSTVLSRETQPRETATLTCQILFVVLTQPVGRKISTGDS